MIGQGYDGASVMSGSNAGVAALLKHDAPFALYVHCHAHRLNLALVDCMKAVPQAAEFFCVVGALICVCIWVFCACTMDRNATTVISD